MAAPVPLGFQPVVTGLPDVLQVAVFVDVANLRERAQRLLDWFADSIGAAGGAGEANIGLYRRRAKAVGAGCDGPPQETGALTQIAERHVVRVVEQTVQAGGMVADVSEREVEIAFELDLGLPLLARLPPSCSSLCRR